MHSHAPSLALLNPELTAAIQAESNAPPFELTDSVRP